MGHGERVTGLDLLRGLAAFAVAIPHFLMYVLKVPSTGAEIASVSAVEVFFVLSGFVLGPQIILCAQHAGWHALKTFWMRRWIRTVPSYLFALIAISIMTHELGSTDFLRYATYLQNLVAQENVDDYFPVAWSLSIEEWYYLTFPLFLLSYLKFLGRRAYLKECAVAAIIFIAGISFIRLYFGDVADWGASVRRVVIFRIDSIAYGFLLYVILQKARIQWDSGRRHVAALFALAATATLVFLNDRMVGTDSFWLRAANPFMSAMFGMSLVLLFLSLSTLIRGRLLIGACTYLGRISYPIYLFHLVIMYALADTIVRFGLIASFLIYVVTMLTFTTLFFYGFEKPILATRPRYRTGRDSDWNAETVLASTS
jgi:peptidoglycan/LPS O-acetylase OafA/YrhL